MIRSWIIIALTFLGLFVLASCRTNGDGVFSVIELVDRVAADEAAWTGKVVNVSGYVSLMPSPSGPQIFVNLVNDRNTSVESHVLCKIPTATLPEEVSGKTITVKGTVASYYHQNYLNLRNVTLDPCEIK